MKGLGIALAGLLAIAGGVAAATIITKKKLEKENDADYFDDWDEQWDDDDADFEFDEDIDITEGNAEAPAEEKKSDMVEEENAPDSAEEL